METIVLKRALDRKVLAVAVVNIWEGRGDWAAYIGAVLGCDHEQEQAYVAKTGNKLPRQLAEAIFLERVQDLGPGIRWRE